ncbi:MAG: CBS domain-containing protein [Candidatus Rokubacteria bacterium]|nr:CBS domain-containing protein [Candidatus Rokubacteria bacterium]
MMLVRDIMQPKVTTIPPKTTLPEAVRLARERGIRHLPVVEGGELIGIVSDRDLKRAMASPATSLEAHELAYLLDRLTVAEIMTRAVITVGPMSPLEDAARLMVLERISALPVTEGGRLVGIVSETDVLQLFVKAMGAEEASSRLDVVLADRPSALTEVVRTLEDAGVTIASIMTLPGRAGLKEAVIRVRTINPGPAAKALEARGYAVRESWRR